MKPNSSPPVPGMIAVIFQALVPHRSETKINLKGKRISSRRRRGRRTRTRKKEGEEETDEEEEQEKEEEDEKEK